MTGITKYLGLATAALTLSASIAFAQPATTQLVAANTKLLNPIDTKTAKAGDAVSVRLTDKVQIAGGPELPRNTVLLGHVDSVQTAQSKGQATIALTFDKAQLKSGQTVPVKATIIAVAVDDQPLLAPALNPDLTVLQKPASAHSFGLSSAVKDAHSGTLTAQGKDFRINSGTQVQLAVAASANGEATGN